MKYILTISLFLAAQNVFANDLMKALADASNMAAADQKAKQIALKVEPDQIAKAKFKKEQAPTVITVQSGAGVDPETGARLNDDEVEVND